MPRHPLIHPKFQGQINNSWPSQCTIQTVTYTTSQANQRVPSGGIDVPGMISISCRISAKVIADVRDNEIKTQSVESKYQRRILKLNGYYPQIISRSMQAVVDGITWKIRGVEADSESCSTRLQLEIIKP